MSIKLQNYRTENGTKTVLVSDKGRKYLHVLMMDGQLVVRKVPKSESRYMTDAIEGKQRRSLSPAVRVYANYGRNHGMTKAAKKMLREARS